MSEPAAQVPKPPGSKAPINVPASQIWREFRMRFLPVGVFLSVLSGAACLWDKTVVGPTMIGEVEAIQSAVVTPDAGIVTNLFVRPFQVVKQGESVGEIVSADPRQFSTHVQDLLHEFNGRFEHAGDPAIAARPSPSAGSP